MAIMSKAQAHSTPGPRRPRTRPLQLDAPREMIIMIILLLLLLIIIIIMIIILIMMIIETH